MRAASISLRITKAECMFIMLFKSFYLVIVASHIFLVIIQETHLKNARAFIFQKANETVYHRGYILLAFELPPCKSDQSDLLKGVNKCEFKHKTSLSIIHCPTANTKQLQEPGAIFFLES